MKKLFFALLLIPFFSNAQQKSCCSPSTMQKFETLASTEAFRESHLAPLPLDYHSDKGEMVKFNCSDGKDANAFIIKSEKTSKKWLLIFHEWWGLNDYIKRESERLQSSLSDVNVLAVDLYDGSVTDKPEEAQKLTQSLVMNRAMNIVKGAIAYCGADSKIATLGWCFRGGWSLQASIAAGKQAAGCVMYYGMPESDISKLKTLQCDVLGLFAKNDNFITPELVSTFQKNMNAAGKKLTVYNYDAVHAFANPSNPKYDEKSASDANEKAMIFLKEKLK